MRALPQDRPLAFTRLSEILVELAGLVPGFLGPKGRIFSLHVPYRCPACKTRRVEVMPVSQLAKRGQGFGAPARNCPKCGKPEEFDALEEEYFSSVRWTPGA